MPTANSNRPQPKSPGCKTTPGRALLDDVVEILGQQGRRTEHQKEVFNYLSPSGRLIGVRQSTRHVFLVRTPRCEIAIKGYRSFSAEQEESLTNLGRLNVVFGPNNTGKSNVQRLLYRVAHGLQNVEKTGFGKLFELRAQTQDNDHWRGQRDVGIEIKLVLDLTPMAERDKELLQALAGNGSGKLTVTFKISDGRFLPNILHEEGHELITPDKERSGFYDPGVLQSVLKNSEPTEAYGSFVRFLVSLSDALVVFDGPVGVTLKKRVRELQESAGRIGQGDPVMITPGREVEHLVRPATLALAAEACVGTIRRKKHKEKKLEYSEPAMDDKKPFAAILASCAKAKDGTPDLVDDDPDHIAGAIAGKKVPIANWVANQNGSIFTDEALEFGRRLCARIRGFVPRQPTGQG